MEPQMISVGKEYAIAAYDRKWWQNKTSKQIVRVQLFTAELCTDFSIFHEALEKCIGQILTHQIVTFYDKICEAFLKEDLPPTKQEILSIIES